MGHRFDEAETRNDLGRARRMQGRHPDAVELHRQALRLAREMGDRRGESVVSNDLALTLAAMGEDGTALELHRRALAIARQIKHPYEEARALDGIAACLRGTDPAAARRHWERALVLYRSMGVPERSEVERRLAGPGSTAAPGEARQDGRRDD